MYIGRQPIIGNFVKLDAITTSATTTFNLLNGGVAYFPQSANNCLVSLNGILQAPTDSYTISGSTIVFSNALTTSDVIDFIIVLGDVLNIGTPSDSTVGFAKVTSNLITGATAETSIDGADSVLIYDDSATALRKMTRTNFVAGITGGILQVKQTLKSDSFVTTNIPNSDTDITGFSVSITPASASNKILIIVSMNMANSGNINGFHFKLQRGGTDIFIGDAVQTRTRGSGSSHNAGTQSHAPLLQTFTFLDAPNSTSSTTYKIVVRDANADNCSFYLNRGNSDSDSNAFVLTASSIQVIEVASSILT